MRVDPVQPLGQDARANTAQDYGTLASTADKLQADSGSLPVQAAAETGAQTQSRDAAQSDKTQVDWSDEPPRVVYKVVSSDGNVVYQMPSTEVLNLAKDINAALQKEAEQASKVDVRS